MGNISTLFFYFFRNTGGHILAQECQPLGVGILEGDVHLKNGHDFLLYFPAEQEPVISPCLSTAGHELTKMCMCRVCSVSIHLRKGLDLCALKIWWIKETWKCVLIVKSCLPEMQTDKCSGPKGLSFSFSRDTQSNRVRARHSSLFAKDLPPECLCTYCHLMKVISLFFFHREPQSLDTLESSQLEEEVDELSLIDHSEIMSRLTLKQEVGAFRVCFHILWFTLR